MRTSNASVLWEVGIGVGLFFPTNLSHRADYNDYVFKVVADSIIASRPNGVPRTQKPCIVLYCVVKVDDSRYATLQHNLSPLEKSFGST